MADSTIPLCAALEAEYTALTGRVAPRGPDLRFTAAQIRDPRAILHQLVQGRDGVATMLRESLLNGTMPRLTKRGVGTDDAASMLAAALNTVLDDDRLFDEAHRTAFDRVALRSETADAVDAGPLELRNRLLLEDAFPHLQRIHDLRLVAVLAALHRERLTALCFSGGGIRSATVALGAITALARHGVLEQLDYLSTVSGGGYTGGWLSAWIARSSMSAVVRALRRSTGRPLEPEPAPVRHLRSFTNYLAPRLGLFSADTWTLGATYLRNLLLNWLVFLPPLVAVLSTPILLRMVIDWRPLGAWIDVQWAVAIVAGASALVAAVGAVRYVHVNRPRQRGPTEGTGNWDPRRSQRDFLRQCLAPMIGAVIVVTVCWAWITAYATPIANLTFSDTAWKTLAVAGAVVHCSGWLLAMHSLRRAGVTVRAKWVRWVGAIGSGAVVGALTGLLTRLAPPLWSLDTRERDIYVWLAAPSLLALIAMLSQLYVGVTSNSQPDAEREWSARFTAWTMIVAVVWFGGVGLVMIGPAIPGAVAAVWRADPGAAIGWVLSLVALCCGTVAAAVAHRTRVQRHRRWPTRVALALATIFFAWLVVMLSMAGSAIVRAATSAIGVEDMTATAAVAIAIAVIVLLLLSGLALSRAIDSNKFSLHAMYRARLIAAYLGASREAGERAPNPFTGYDDDDNMHLRDLRPAGQRGPRRRAPLHVLNATLNLVGGANLAWQERKAEPFTFSPLHCGSPQLGYRPTQRDTSDDASPGYGGDRGASLGTAMAISGAAASPAMGYHSSPVLSLLLTFFNVRLGWWLGNPGDAGRDVWQRSSPRSSLGPIIDEALGLTDDRNAYVHLTDGGHFENLGLYAMVLRRCRTIVVVDASTDPALEFADLAESVRKIRIDFGIPIDIDLSPITDGGACYAVGTVGYDAVDAGAVAGTLIYLKPVIDPHTSADIASYARRHGAFPHDTTLDQWFTESEFESYRALGARMVDALFEANAGQSSLRSGSAG